MPASPAIRKRGEEDSPAAIDAPPMPTKKRIIIMPGADTIAQETGWQRGNPDEQ